MLVLKERAISEEEKNTLISREVEERHLFNIKFKGLQTFEELKSFLDELYSSEFRFKIVGKRSGCRAYHFTHLYESFESENEGIKAEYLNRVSFIYDDKRIKGQAYVKNLYRSLVIK